MSTSTLRKFVVGVWAQRAGRRTLSDLTHELPREFVRDVNNAVTSGGKDNPRLDRDRTPTPKDLGIKEPARMATPQVLAHRPRMGLPTRRRTTVHILLNMDVTSPGVRSAMDGKYHAPAASDLGQLD
ncbi:hypothetical protein BJX68DRAFT_233182 [Aspergillus pseudodeflectus]|uniref:Uncharacterized protein n=1 Tax=Aspergillus pseudodeflectus TaxID=176178 RepID=A0ABR4KMR4_9EURO